ncbi:hypothetical protein D3C85_1679350 [compost metagenome]
MIPANIAMMVNGLFGSALLIAVSSLSPGRVAISLDNTPGWHRAGFLVGELLPRILYRSL